MALSSPAPIAFNIETARAGQLTISRPRAKAFLNLGEIANITDGVSETAVVKYFLAQLAGRQDGAGPTDENLDQLSSEELERFASGIIETVPSLCRRVNRPEDLAVKATGTGFVKTDNETYVGLLARVIGHRLRADAARAARDNSMMKSLADMGNMFPAAIDSAKLRGASHIFDKPAVALTERHVAVGPPPLPRPADKTLRVVDEQLKAFSEQLSSDESAELVAISAPGGASFYVQQRTAVSAEMISLQGFDTQGNPVEVVQHYSQCNIAFIKVPKNPPSSMGFVDLDRDRS